MSEQRSKAPSPIDFVCGDYDLRPTNPRGGSGADFVRCGSGAAYECGHLLVCKKHYEMRKQRGDDVQHFTPLLIWNAPEGVQSDE